jgi:hypothetical protein
MKNILRILLLAVFWCTNFKYAHAQLVSGDVFLKGNFVEVGIGPNGAFGSANNSPAGYHPRSSPSTALGFVADPDKDGWGTGTPTFVGDFFMPGTPQEGWDVQVNGTRANAWRGSGTGFSSASLTGSNTGFVVSDKKKRGVFQGAMGNLSITQTTTLDTEKLFFVVNVKLKNTGTSTLLNVFYNRTVDPDNAVMLTGSYVTNNVIAKQAASSPDNGVLVEANASAGAKNIYLGLGTKDCRAKCYIVDYDLFATASVTDIWTNSGSAASYIQNVGGTKNDDVGIGLLFNIGNIAVGDSTILSYTYILRQADLDSAMEEIQPKWLYGSTELKSRDTIKGCVGDVLPVSIINGDGLSWGTWTSLVGLSSTSGRTNNITVQSTATTYRVIGTAASCNADTMFLVVAPDAPPSAPTVTTPVNLCVGGPSATLSAIGTKLKWYSVSSGGTALASAPTITTASASSATFYVSQTTVAKVGGCEGTRSAITANVNPLPAAPTVTSPVNLCVGGPGTTLTATGSNLKWYTSASGGSPLAAAPTITTGSPSSTIYYVSQSLDASAGSCEGNRSAITVNVNALPSAPTVTSPVNLCVGGPGATLTATGSNLKWYTSASGGTALASAPTITTGAASSVTYYVSQSLDTSAGSCEGNRSAITVNVNALPSAPTVTTPVNLCVGGPGTTLTATGTNLKWYTAASGGSPLAAAPAITTGSPSSVIYYVSQSLGASSGSCEGDRSAITANVNPLPTAPTVTSPVNLCVGGPGTTLTATGTNLKWYTVASGGTALAGAPAITTGSASSTIYYVSQSLDASAGSCEGDRSAITVNVNALPSAPTVTSPVSLCVGGPGTTLTATGSNLKWYTVATGGTASTTAPTITTGAASSVTYYVSQSLDTSAGSCEGNRSAITVNVNALPSAPTVITPVNLCVGGPGTTLTATGTNLKWYTAASGGSPLAAAPAITTGSPSSVVFFVSQSLDASVGSCEGNRSAITANVNALPSAPTITTPVNLCVGGPSTTLTAIGTNLRWYTVATGGTASTTAPTITTGSPSSVIHFVSQSLAASSGSCEGARSAITANVNALPSAPIVTSPVNLCVGGPGTTLTATGSNLRWYTVATGGTASTTAPTITTGSPSSVIHYVSQSLDASAGSCEGPRSAITVNVTIPPVPTVTTPVNLCVGGPGATLTATGINLKWYTVPTGGSPMAGAPVITTGSASSTIYYVSQTSDASVGGCEGNRSAITANVNALPLAPTVTTPVNLCVGGPGATLTATGTNLKWYTVASGGTALASAPTITTGAASSATYFVSQSLAAALGGCEGTDRATLTANVNNPPLAPVVTTPVTLCIGGADSSLTATGTNLKWYTVATGGIGTTTAPKIKPSSLGSSIYYVSSSLNASSGGCEGPRSMMSVNVQPVPTLVITPVGVPDFVFCDSRTVQLLGTSPTAVSYQWAFGGVSIPTGTTDTLSAGKGGYYSLLVKNVFGCGRRDSVLVKPTPFPTPILSPTEVQMCDGTDIMLYSAPAAAGYTYQWFKDGLPLGISLSENKTPVSIAGNYQVIITDIYTCVKTTNFSTVSTYAPVPKPNVLRTGTILTLDKPYSKYQWYRNNKIIAGATLRSYTMVLDGAYHAQVWDKNGCENYSDTLQSKALTISATSSNDVSIKIYPNPTTDILYIESPINVKATVFDALGRKLLEVKKASSVSLKSFADGMYLLYITDNEGMLIGTYKIRKTE